MRKTFICIAALFLAATAGHVPMVAQEGGKPAPALLVPGYEAARDVPGAAELPDPTADAILDEIKSLEEPYVWRVPPAN